MGEFDNIRIPWTGWKVKEKLGEGGYGEVYKIERTQHGAEDCEALKIIRIPKNRQEYDSLIYSAGSEDKAKKILSKQKDDIINEIEALTRLRGNDNVVKINGWSEEKLYDGYGWEIYIRMDALTPLKKYINGKKGQKLEEEEVIRLGIDICNALKQCEEQNIVHRDIKPDNILVSSSGKFMLTDFGIAKTLVEETTMTGAGTGWYMAPEVARYTKANKTVDIYSLGLVMYELLNNNRLPFLKTEGIVGALERNTAKQRRLDGEDLPEPAQGSDELKRIVLKATMADRSRRYESAQAMFRDLEMLSGKMNETLSEKSGEHEKTDSDFPTPSFLMEKEEETELRHSSTQTDTDKRIYELLRRAENGDATAQFDLGWCYDTGEGVEQNYEEAVKWYRLAAEQGHATAQNNIGVCYQNGEGVEQNYEEAVKWFRLAAEQGYATAQNNLGVCYTKGYGEEQNYEEAVKWYRLAAEQGHARAQYNTGWCYENGYGVEQNYEEAVKWYRLAAEQGHATAQNNIGVCYQNGEGVEQNYEEAVKWYKLAAEQGHATAQNNLGAKYDNGLGVEQNYEEAVKWYRLAAEQGHATAQCSLGWCYENGYGVEQNYEEAVKWYKKSAEQGYATAQCSLGWCYQYGEGVEQNYEEAVKWYRLAAEQGQVIAQYNLGNCYRNGEGVEQNYEEAVKWYRQAVEQGYEEAQSYLEACYAKMKEEKSEKQEETGTVEITPGLLEETEAEETDNNTESLSQKELPDEPTIIEEIRKNKRDAIIAEKKKKRKTILAIILALLFAAGALAYNIMKPENDPEIKEAYDGFKAVADENGWEVLGLGSTDMAYAHTLVWKEANGDDIDIGVNFYKKEKDFEEEANNYRDWYADSFANDNFCIYTDSDVLDNNQEEQRVIAFKDKMIIKARIKSAEDKKEVFSLLEALGVETPPAISGHYLEERETINGWSCGVYELDEPIVNAESAEIGVELTKVEGDPKGSYKIMFRSDGKWDNYWTVDLEESDKLYVDSYNLGAEYKVEALALVPDSAKPEKYSCRFEVEGVMKLPSD